MKKNRIYINVLVAEYTENSKIINKANEKLLNNDRGLFKTKLKTSLNVAKSVHKKQLEKLEELDDSFVGDLESYMHDNIALLSIKDANYKVVERARTVFTSSLGRFENTIANIEDSLNFNQSIMLARISIVVAILSIATSYFSG
ncbi:TPA: hypothetical protein NKO89_004830 [Vibrio parahaemolyticus]|uniref:hypothetical protein n=1 Tax=Vibrio parahaemolyticus TaxID=670 RepID=UPI001121E0CE|nr:hypothetical protein [Vibrio parahaemolyticus]TOO91756.1 hypothetical protein CGH25_23995 [Vibrio parahaemolyticus]TOO97433.1 hypothetical protein CGH24_23315 [Vibrio parahaemolyticus]HCH0720705.1 hypothetical protein [Vibrio parahaemolyticus]